MERFATTSMPYRRCLRSAMAADAGSPTDRGTAGTPRRPDRRSGGDPGRRPRSRSRGGSHTARATTANQRSCCRSMNAPCRKRCTTETTPRTVAAANASGSRGTCCRRRSRAAARRAGWWLPDSATAGSCGTRTPTIDNAITPIRNGRQRRDGSPPVGNTRRYTTIPSHAVATSSHEFSHSAQDASSMRPSWTVIVNTASAHIVSTSPRPITISSHPHGLAGSREAINPPTTAKQAMAMSESAS